MALSLSVAPIALLIWMMTRKNAVPSFIALPLTAAVVFLVQVLFFRSGVTLASAHAMTGLLAALTPISIIAGAILLNRMMQLSGAEVVVRRWLESISPNPVAQLMIIGWAFAFMLEGASGFGTPPAIAAPILVGLGFEPFRVALLALVMNSVPVSFGAVGTPTWFGFAPLGMSEADLLLTSQKTALIHLGASLVIPLMALRFVVPWHDIQRNGVFVFSSILACTVPYVLLAQVNYEFPALVGGAIGLTLSVWLAGRSWGLCSAKRDTRAAAPTAPAVLRALTPLLMLIGILTATRVEQFGIKAALNNTDPLLGVSLGWLGNLSVSKALIVSLESVLGTPASVDYKTLYVPAAIPFLLTVLICIPLLRIGWPRVARMFRDSFASVGKPFVALMGALVMVNLMMLGENAPVIVIGTALARLTGRSWQLFAAYLGAVGAFFSGSNTVSNLTFGGIQQSIAHAVGLDPSLVLALQSVGGAMGNMVCINNIIAVGTILGLANCEGRMLRKTVVPTFVYGAVAALMSLLIGWL
jgi:lactate permease